MERSHCWRLRGIVQPADEIGKRTAKKQKKKIIIFAGGMWCSRPPAVLSKPMSETLAAASTTTLTPPFGVKPIRARLTTPVIRCVSLVCRASMVDSHESPSDFARRTEQAWLISQQPRPVACLSCNSSGHVECKWCRGTGFFILGDNMLCQVPSRNSSCVICSGKGSMRCSDCKGTGFRAKWLGEPPGLK